MSMIIQTPRLMLREWKEEDVEPYLETCNTEAVMAHLGGVRARSEVRQEVADLISQQRDYGFTLWVLEEKSSGAFVGFCGLDQLDYLDEGGPSYDPNCTVKGELELGFRLREDFWERGLATEASAAALLIAFEKLRARRVVSRTERENVASRRVLEKLGFLHDFGLDYWPTEKKLLLVHTMNSADWPASPAAAKLSASQWN